jgi:hypothetical protein
LARLLLEEEEDDVVIEATMFSRMPTFRCIPKKETERETHCPGRKRVRVRGPGAERYKSSKREK